MSQEPILSAEDIQFADNPEPRCACVLVVDTSGSMQGAPLEELNQGLQLFASSTREDAKAARRVEVAVMAFDDTAQLVQDFTTVHDFQPPVLRAGNATALGSAVIAALDLLESRKQKYREAGVAYYRPWIFIMTDGLPTDPPAVLSEAVNRVHEAEEKKRAAVFSVGIGEQADMNFLTLLGKRQPVRLRGLNFGEMFLWLSRSLQAVSHSRPEENHMPGESPKGWAEF